MSAAHRAKIAAALTKTRDTKWCPHCDQMRPIGEFDIRAGMTTTPKSYCRSCTKAYNATKARKSWETHFAPGKPRRAERQRQYRNWHLRARFGLTPDDYQALLASQGGACAICLRSKPAISDRKKDFAVDHCHVTGRVRGLLCDSCNRGLGMFQDDPRILEAAARYLNR